MKSITAKDLTKIIILVVVLVGMAWFLGRISWVIQLAIISLLIVYVLFPLTELLENRYRFPHFPAVGAVFLLFLFVIVAIISLIVPVLQKETKEIIRDFPFYLRQFQFYLEEVSNYLTNIDLSPDLMNALLQLPAKLQPALEEFASYSISLVFSVVDIFFILFIVFYLLYDFRNVRQAILRLVPAMQRTSYRLLIAIWGAIYRVISCVVRWWAS